MKIPAKAEIEAALERIRAQAIAMDDSKDIGNAIEDLFSELEKLELVTLRCEICIFEESHYSELWASIPAEESKVSKICAKLDMTIHPMLQGILNAWKEKSPFFLYTLSGDVRLNYYKAVATSTNYGISVQNKEGDAFIAEKEFCGAFFFKEGCLLTFTSEAFSNSKKPDRGRCR